MRDRHSASRWSVGLEGFFLDEAVDAAVRLSARYLSGRQLPDKSVSVLDTACAKVALGQSATPAIIEDTRKHLDRLQAEISALQRETAGGSDQHGERLAELHAQQAEAQAVLASNEERLGRERDLAGRIAVLRQQMEQGEAASGDPEPSNDDNEGDVAVAKPAAKRGKAKAELSPQHAELARLQAELRELQGETPMVPLQVDGTVVADLLGRIGKANQQGQRVGALARPFRGAIDTLSGPTQEALRSGSVGVASNTVPMPGADAPVAARLAAVGKGR